MACPLSAILNPVHDSAQIELVFATRDDDDDDDATISEASTEIIDGGPLDKEMSDEQTIGFNTSIEHQRSPLENGPSVGESAHEGIRPPIIPLRPKTPCISCISNKRN